VALLVTFRVAQWTKIAENRRFRWSQSGLSRFWQAVQNPPKSGLN